MKKNCDYLQDYLDAYQMMKNRAIEVMRDYGEELDVTNVGKRLIMEHYGYSSEDDVCYDELSDWMDNNVYCCVFQDKHGSTSPMRILKTRYNDDLCDIDVCLEHEEGFFSGWYPAYKICGDRDAAYMTVLDFIN
jgi:hypothetical protein